MTSQYYVGSQRVSEPLIALNLNSVHKLKQPKNIYTSFLCLYLLHFISHTFYTMHLKCECHRSTISKNI